MDAITNLKISAPAAAQFSCATLDEFLHRERGIARAHGVIFVGKRRTEYSHKSITHNSIYCSFEAMDGLEHVLDHRFEKVTRLFRVTVRDKFRRTLYVGEKDGDVFT